MIKFIEAAIQNLNGWGIMVFIFILGSVELLLGLLEGKWSKNDKILDIVCLVAPRFIFSPLIGFFSLKILPFILPGLKDAFAWVPFSFGFFIILVTIDLSQYWYHRLHHQLPVLWRFHRTHHSARYMSVVVNSRQNIFYVAFLSQLYITAALVYLGLGGPALLFNGFQTIWSYACHTSVKWDKILYRYKILHPFAWLLERVLVTPATHHAHHAATHGDGVGFYKGNFGGILFLWDILFGTAHISRRYPKQYGLSSYKDDPWYAQWLWPVLKSPVEGSELAKDGPEVIEDEPELVDLKNLQNA
jgi:sterol desaturase/sphingolipid hydroxylase (fatty acid hydroxylase superfamily)